MSFLVSFIDETTIFVGQNLADGAWHKVDVNVTSGQVTVRVDSSQAMLRPSGGQFITHFEKTLFLGSVWGNYFELANILGSATVSGCMRRMFINGAEVTFEHAQSVSLFPLPEAGCRKEDSCRPNPCENDGKCLATWTGFECRCLADFGGKTCQNGEWHVVEGPVSRTDALLYYVGAICVAPFHVMQESYQGQALIKRMYCQIPSSSWTRGGGKWGGRGKVKGRAQQPVHRSG